MYNKNLLFYVVLAFLLSGLRADAVQLSGAYTIDPLQAPSATNFRNFESAVAYLTGIGSRTDTSGLNNTAPFGVSGPVTFHVAAGTYPVLQPVIIRAIQGASAANRVTFSGAGMNTTVITGSMSSPLLKLSLCKYVTITHIGMINAANGIGIALIGSRTSDSGSACSITRCRIEAPRYGINVTSDTNGIEVNTFCRVDSITIDSNTIVGSSVGVFFSGNQQTTSAPVFNHNIRIRYNTMERIMQTGIKIQFTGGVSIVRENTINMGSLNASGAIGIHAYEWSNIDSVASSELYGNKILGKYQTGINVFNGSGTSHFPTRIANNLIIGPWDAFGIYLVHQNEGHHYEIYHNTAYSTNALAKAGAGLLYTSSQGSIKAANNIFAGLLLQHAVSLEAPDTQVYLNHNTYYTGFAPVILILRNNVPYFAHNFQATLAGGDSSSFLMPDLTQEGKPLHGCGLTGRNLLADVPIDLEGAARSTSPTNGCYEFLPFTTDLELVKLLNPVVPITTGMQNIEIVVRNIGTGPVYSFRANYRLNGGPLVSEPHTTTLNPCDTVTFRFTTPVSFGPANALSVYLDNQNGGTDQDHDNDSLIAEFFQPSSGSFSIAPSGADFPDMTTALNHLQRSGVNGPVVLNVAPAVYFGAVQLTKDIPGASEINSITFEGTDRNTCVIDGSVSGTPLISIGTSHIHLRNFTVNCRIAGSGWAVKINGRNASDISIKHTTINMLDPLANPSNAGMVIEKDGLVENVEIDSNIFNFGAQGIYSYPTEVNRSLSIRGNEFRRTYTNGILLGLHSGVEIRNNRIEMESTMPDMMAEGITLYGCTPAIFTDNIEITGNTVLNSIQAGIKVMDCENPAGKRGLVNNNVISGGHQDGYSAGILIAGIRFFNIDHNSVLMRNMSYGSAIDFDFFGGTDNRIRNNHFVKAPGSGGYVAAFWDLSLITDLDYNNYYREDTLSSDFVMLDFMTYDAATFRGVNGFNLHSIVTDPEFINDTLLMTKRPCMLGDTLGVPTDIAGVMRKSPPDIGAYEVVLHANDAGISSILSPAFPVDSGAQDLVVLIRNFGTSLFASTVTYELNGGPPVSTVWNGVLSGCDSTTAEVRFTGIQQVNIVPGVPNMLKVYTEFPNGASDGDHENDTLEQLLITPLNGRYTLGGGNADYASFAEASSALDLRGISGPVTFDVKADTVYVEESFSINPFPGNGLFPVTFQRAGAGANPKVCAMSGTGSQDAVIHIKGADNVHFNGIDVFDSTLFFDNVLQMEYGFLVTNNGAANGASGNSIANSLIKLKWNSTTSLGYGTAIMQSSSASDGGASNAAILEGGNHNNRYENIRTEFCSQGIILVADRFFPDSNNVVTSSGSDTTIIGGTPGYEMSSLYQTSGILAYCQKNVEISNCTVRHIKAQTGTGIYVHNRLTGSPALGNAVIKSNLVHDIHGSATGRSSGIQVTVKANDMATVSNNVVHDLYLENPATPESYWRITGIGHCLLSGEGPGSYLNNTVSISSGAALNATSTAFWKGTSSPVTLINNAFINTTGAQTGAATHHAFYIYDAPITGSSNNLFWSEGANGSLGYYISQPVNSIHEWAMISNDKTSLSYQPDLNTLPHLRPNPADPASWALNGRGIHTDSAIVRTDINGTPRPLNRAEGVPDIGAYEFTPASLPPVCEAVPATITGTQAFDTVQAFLFGGDTVATIVWPAGHQIPATVQMRQYTGVKPPHSGTTPDHIYTYTDVRLSNESNYNYLVNLYYNPEWLGTIPVEQDMRMIAKTPNMPWMLSNISTIDPAAGIVSGWSFDTSMLLTGTNQYNPLPVQLLNLTATKNNTGAIVNWVTASEINCSYFVVERSVDNKRFEDIGRVQARGNTSLRTGYSYNDRNLQHTGIIYYRLRITDADGRFTHSYVVSVNMHKEAAGHVANAYPNPFTDELFIPVTSEQPESVQVSLADITGKVLMIRTYEVNSGNHALTLQTQEWAPGVYLVTTEINGVRNVQKVIRN